MKQNVIYQNIIIENLIKSKHLYFIRNSSSVKC